MVLRRREPSRPDGQVARTVQHRVAQYNYVDERRGLEALGRRFTTRVSSSAAHPRDRAVSALVGGLDLTLFQYLRVAAWGNTSCQPRTSRRRSVPWDTGDAYATLATRRNLALHLELPAPIAGKMLEDLGREGYSEFPNRRASL